MAAPDYESVVDEESGQPSQVGDDERDQPEAPAPRKRITIELRPKEAVPNGRHQPEEEVLRRVRMSSLVVEKSCAAIR